MFQSWKILWLTVEANPELATFVRRYVLTYGAPPESHRTVASIEVARVFQVVEILDLKWIKSFSGGGARPCDTL